MPTGNQQRSYRIRLHGKHGQNQSPPLADHDHERAPFHTNPNPIPLRLHACRTSRNDSLAFVLPSVRTFLFWCFHHHENHPTNRIHSIEWHYHQNYKPLCCPHDTHTPIPLPSVSDTPSPRSRSTSYRTLPRHPTLHKSPGFFGPCCTPTLPFQSVVPITLVHCPCVTSVTPRKNS